MDILILLIIGIFNFIAGYQLRFNDAFRAKYVKNSPKALIWRKMFGEEKALGVIRNLALIPLIIGLGFILWSGWIYLGY
jgi:hypothetical protein